MTTTHPDSRYWLTDDSYSAGCATWPVKVTAAELREIHAAAALPGAPAVEITADALGLYRDGERVAQPHAWRVRCSGRDGGDSSTHEALGEEIARVHLDREDAVIASEDLQEDADRDPDLGLTGVTYWVEEV